VDTLHRSRQSNPCDGILRARGQYNPSHCISPATRCLTLSSCAFGLLFWTITLALWPTVTIRQNVIIGYMLAVELQCNGWHCEDPSSRSFYLHAKCNALFTKYTHHSKLPDLCGYWQSIARSVCLLCYYMKLSLELRVRSQQCFPCWWLTKQWLPVCFSLVDISRLDPSYQSFHVLWWVPGLTSTQRKLDPNEEVDFK
jgi:hypothetical protein